MVGTGSSPGKESACNAEDPGLTLASGRRPGELVAQMVKYPPAMQETWV